MCERTFTFHLWLLCCDLFSLMALNVKHGNTMYWSSWILYFRSKYISSILLFCSIVLTYFTNFIIACTLACFALTGIFVELFGLTISWCGDKSHHSIHAVILECFLFLVIFRHQLLRSCYHSAEHGYGCISVPANHLVHRLLPE